ncbi:MAG: hypothetical protein HY651_05520, partial [Acidobacteria bacterium]|nr:hypothetical protein [Acidobacteriota bacterium]
VLSADALTARVEKSGGLTSAAATDGLPTAAAGTSGQIAKFHVDGSTLVDSVVVENAGNIGIGTATPAKLLQVAGGDIGIRGGVPRMQFFENDGAADTGKWSLVADAGLFRFTTTNDAENFDVSRLAIDRNGNIGIGTTAPAKLL